METIPRFFAIPGQSFFPLGPRGTGKSTWLQHELKDALFVDLLRPETYREMAARPERLRELVMGSPRQDTIVIDEIQRVPELLNVVHECLESLAPRRFVLTGSSARKLRRGGVDLLAGRALLRTMHPFMAAELSEFSLQSALETGLVPLVVSSSNPEDVLKAYAGLYVEQEVRAEGLTRNVGAFSRFLEAISFSHASILNTSNVARECQIERKTVAAYIEALGDLLLSFHLPVFTVRARRETVSHAKFYFFDAGVYRSLRPRGPLDRAQEIEGAALEGLVAQHLRAWIAYSGVDARLFYWRTRSGVEVDFIVYGSNEFWAVEVKNSAKVKPSDLRSLKTFARDYPECTCIFLYRGCDRMRIDGIWCIPAGEFLKNLRPSVGMIDWLVR